jgi:hypothetical protein
MSYDQRFYWTEPFAFAMARGREITGGSKLPLFAIVAVLLAIALIAADPPSVPSDFALVAAFSIGLALLIAYPTTWLLSRLPNSVLVAADRVVIGREIIPLTQIQSAIIGTTRMGGSDHPVFVFRTKDGREQMYGLSGKVDLVQLSKFLEGAGIREPQT